MNKLINYSKPYQVLKNVEKDLITKYNRCRTKESKKKVFEQISFVERQLEELRRSVK